MQYLTIKEVETKYNISRTTIWRFVKAGKLKTYRSDLKPTKPMFLEEELKKLQKIKAD